MSSQIIKCTGKTFIGENSPCWKSNKVGREEHEFTPAQKKEILKRYNYRCAVTGLHMNSVHLQIHHVDWVKNGGTRVIENGVPLWVEVHKKVHFEDYDITEYILGDNYEKENKSTAS